MSEQDFAPFAEESAQIAAEATGEVYLRKLIEAHQRVELRFAHELSAAERECEQLRALLRQVRDRADDVVNGSTNSWSQWIGVTKLLDESDLLDGGQR